MSRRRRAIRRVIPAEPRYGSVDLAQFINKVMSRGKKSVAQRIVYEALELVQQDAKREPLEVFQQAMRNCTPMLEVKPRRVGGATYQVPVEISEQRGAALAVRWLIRAARTRVGQAMFRKLAQELVDASRGQGAAVKRREDLHRMAEANRAFAHYRW